MTDVRPTPHEASREPPFPEPGDFAPFYRRYIELAVNAGVWHLLHSQADTLAGGLASVNDSSARERYAPGKWSIKQVIGHLSDTERIFSYRALRIARGDDVPLPGFDQELYADASGIENRSLRELLEEFASVRAATISLVRSIPADGWGNRGTAGGEPVTVAALACMIPGHVQHHLDVLHERYGVRSLRDP